jgi:hypothetical protein
MFARAGGRSCGRRGGGCHQAAAGGDGGGAPTGKAPRYGVQAMRQLCVLAAAAQRRQAQVSHIQYMTFDDSRRVNLAALSI